MKHGTGRGEVFSPIVGEGKNEKEKKAGVKISFSRNDKKRARARFLLIWFEIGKKENSLKIASQLPFARIKKDKSFLTTSEREKN